MAANCKTKHTRTKKQRSQDEADDSIYTATGPHVQLLSVTGLGKELNISSMSQMGMTGVDYMSLIITYNAAHNFLMISQRSYIEKSLRMFGLENMQSSPTPMATG